MIPALPPAPIRAVVTTVVGGRTTRLPVCACGELLRGAPARCRNRQCQRYYSEREIHAALDTFAPLKEDEAA